AIYHRGKMDSNLAAIRTSELFIQKTNHSVAASEVNPEEYGGIFYPGGGGQFYDVWNNERIAKIASSIYENGGVIGVAGHGAVSLLNIKLSDGRFLVNGKKITCFPKAISARWLPIDWEQGLKDRGAVVVLPVTADEKENGVQLNDDNGRIISGTYAENASWVAQQIALFLKTQRTH
ncbi:MAG: DJ-1/PfpI family protein, partial [Chitinophagaceae bacterium]|nr:DJ-1/PfpI family protein [Chitinophagaceae bacterium]